MSRGSDAPADGPLRTPKGMHDVLWPESSRWETTVARFGELDDAHADRLDESRNRREYFRERSVCRELREHFALGSRDTLCALSLRDIRNTSAHQATAAAR